MKGGHNRTSPRLKVLQGGPAAANTPKPRPLTPSCPSWLDRTAKAEWRRVCPILDRMGVLTEIDGAALAGYCASYSLWRRCQEEIGKGGLLQAGHRGVERRHPLLITLRQAEQSMRGFLDSFGMTPLSRERLTVSAADDGTECSQCGLPNGPNGICGCFP